MPYLLILFLPWVASLVGSIVSARRMKTSVGLAVLLGVLFSPAAGIIYGYMALSGDKNRWRAGLIGAAICIVLVAISAGILVAITNGATQSIGTQNSGPSSETSPFSPSSFYSSNPRMNSGSESPPSQVSRQKLGTNNIVQTSKPAPATHAENIGATYQTQVNQFIGQLRSISNSYYVLCLGNLNTGAGLAESGDYNSAQSYFDSAHSECSTIYDAAVSLGKTYDNAVPTNYAAADYYMVLAVGYSSNSLNELSNGNYSAAITDSNNAQTAYEQVLVFLSSLP